MSGGQVVKIGTLKFRVSKNENLIVILIVTKVTKKILK